MSLPRLVRPRLLKPSLHTRPKTHLCLFARRNASTKEPKESTRPLVLEQPDKFRPPSHGARKPRKPRHFGPSLSDEEIKEQATKRYPHSMPPEGTVMRKFLESKGIHVWISMSVLVSLTGFVLLTDFKTKNKFPELLPPSSTFWSNPVSFVQQYFAVYKLHSEAYMAEQQEKRARALDEARKRKEYLIAHGIEKEGLFGFGTVEGDARKEKRRREREAMDEERIREEHNEESIGGNTSNGTRAPHAQEDYQMQPMLLEQQNKQRLAKAKQEHYDGGQNGSFLGHGGKMLTSGAEDVKETGEEKVKKAKKWFGIW